MNETYDYIYNVKEDVREYIEREIKFSEFEDREELQEYLYDTLWAEDSITGNRSGSYYCNAYSAEQALAGNTDLLLEALIEFGEAKEMTAYDLLTKGAEWADCTIRCYVLGQAISEALDELYKEEGEEYHE